MRVPVPSASVELHERVLSVAEVASLACTGSAREIASDFDGIILGSEVVTKTEGVGYIYRYDVSEVVHDDDGHTHKINSRFVIWSNDCKSFSIASYPTFKLPDFVQK